ncbi:leucine-rich repeat-containing protein 40, partial [Octopus bimaculoides]|uniref:leucine-rich repeat-containing protein 40 n=1 Tax=Octopus bimaculoides TaxID=37653 RepID=UPI0022E7AB5F
SNSVDLLFSSIVPVPKCVLNINIEEVESARNFTLDSSAERWWDQTDLTRLIIANNCLNSLPEDIRLIHALNLLDVHDNNLESLPDTLGDLIELQKLVLSRNKLTTLPDTIQQLQNLTVLQIDNNNMTNLPDGIGQLSNLEDLNASNNSLVTLPPNLGKLTKVRNLNLSSNQLTTIPAEVGNMSQMRNSVHELHLGFNYITELSKEHLAPLGQITLMDLRDNKLKEIPAEITLLANLQRLDLTNNSLQGLPNEVGLMVNLRNLQFDGNPIRNIRRDIIMVGRIIFFFITFYIFFEKKQKNKIVFKLIESLSELHMGFNKLTCLPADIGKMVHLTYLDVRNNCMTDLPEEISQLKNLREIKFSTIPPVIYTLSKLEILFINGNKLTEVDVDSLQKLPILTTLNLQNNNLTQIPPELALCPKLACLQLEGNALRNPRAAIIAKGSSAILDYLRDRIIK